MSPVGLRPVSCLQLDLHLYHVASGTRTCIMSLVGLGPVSCLQWDSDLYHVSSWTWTCIMSPMGLRPGPVFSKQFLDLSLSLRIQKKI
ncbi:hypothetical protein DPMN_009280 [Dreissena polymorpha]|uniref:Uncharacterized protein n=1 Tax=Dreissena polymorpha TaxID=45954 RepID=A0A9D4S0G0_DREPO|nr:hypothetical protein DPMN_009280 [Dreissena polymorpha]